MNDESPPPPGPRPDPRADRLAQALRANLRRRKAGPAPRPPLTPKDES